MTRIANARTNGTLAWLSLVFLAASAAACISSRITVADSDGEAFAHATSLHVTSVGDVKGSTDTSTASVANALRSQAEAVLRAKGYSIADAVDGDLILEIAHRTEPVSRRTWSSDPDASALKIVHRTDAVLALRGRDRNDDREVFFCDARAPLPESGRPFAPSMDELWTELLEHALTKVPARRRP